MNKSEEMPRSFEAGVADYFAEFGHRQARETSHQTWLLISVAKYIQPQLVVAELALPNQDIGPFGDLKASRGGLSFDFAISRSEIDLRTWRTRTPGWKHGATTIPQTLQTLNEIVVLAELKIAKSTSTNDRALLKDLQKLTAAILFMKHHRCPKIPACYFVVLDPDRTLNVPRAIEPLRKSWPKDTPFPKILLGP